MKLRYLLLFLLSTLSLNAQFVTQNGQLRVEGTNLVNQSGEKIALRGVSFGWHCYHPRFYNKGAVKWLKNDWNCTVVRAALGVEQSDQSYLKQPEVGKKLIKNVIQAAIKNDIYVIVDWHSHNINLKEATVFFDEISKKYGKHPNVIYEIFNEPDEESWEEVKAYSEEIIKVIRANDPDNIILIGSPRWDQEVQLPAADPIKGFSNLMYTMHFYAGTHEKWLRDRTDEAIAKGLPIFISESAGMEATGDGPLNYKAWQEYVDWMEARGLSWITWSISDKNESCSMINTSASSNGNWTTEDLKESGIKMREYLLELNRKK
jgi:endoglucanase